MNVSAQSAEKFTYMDNMPASQIFGDALKENRPVLVFVHSKHCMSSRKFNREIMNLEAVAVFFKTNFKCMNADVGTKNGNRFAKIHDLLNMPALMLYSPDKKMSYLCHLKLDHEYVLNQAVSFLNAFNIREQIKQFRFTNKVTKKEAAMAIGRSYALIDFRRNEKEKSKNMYYFAMQMRLFKSFAIGYNDEWEKLRRKQVAKK
jgi:hypothetical protein